MGGCRIIPFATLTITESAPSAIDWRERLLAEAMASGVFARASLSVNVEGVPDQPQHLNVFETTRPDALAACKAVLVQLQPDALLAPPAEVRMRYCDAWHGIFMAGDQ